MILTLKHNCATFLLSLTIVIISLISCSNDEGIKQNPLEETESTSTLRDKASFNIGAAVAVQYLDDARYGIVLRKHFNQITAEYEMKMNSIWDSKTDYNWSKADALVKYAEENNMEVHGHALLWYKSFPNWFKEAQYDSALFESMVKTYIETTVGRYKGRISSWDVANEIFNNDGTLRSVDCPVFATFNDPIAFYGRCFQYAKNADPEVKLFYNDYGVVLSSGKRHAMKQMSERFRKEGYPIDGFGDQFHYKVSTDRAAIKHGLDDLASAGLLIHISELDLRVNVNKNDNYVFSASEQQKQADAYEYIVAAYEAIPDDQKFAITTWGVTDKMTWLLDWWHHKEYPLLFDKDYQKKPAYDGFWRGLEVSE